MNRSADEAIGRDFRPQHLDRDELACLTVARLVDDAHAAAAGFLEKLVPRGELGGPGGTQDSHAGRLYRAGSR